MAQLRGMGYVSQRYAETAREALEQLRDDLTELSQGAPDPQRRETLWERVQKRQLEAELNIVYAIKPPKLT